MQSPPPEKYTYPKTVPESTNDVNLKRARVVDNNGKSYIRVTGTVTSSDLDPIKEALGDPTDTSSENTVIGLLKKIDVKQFGVGQAYPGSTGGEIFNYYGTDSNKNVASGNYSTARGLHNTSSGTCAVSSGTNNTASGVYSTAIGQANTASGSTSFTAGVSNTASTTGTIALGSNNQNSGSYAITLGVQNTATALNTLACGNYNNVKSQNSQAFGEDNTIDTSSNNSSIFGRSNTIKKAGVIIGSNNEITTQTGNVLIGSNLTDNTNNNVVIVGRYNTTPTISNPKLILASGGGSSTKTNAIECNAGTTKIRNNLQLATNSYEVNDITAPLSSPASVNDMTLATKAYVDANGGFTPESTEIFAMYPYTSAGPPVDLGEIPYQKGRVVLRGTLEMTGYTSTPLSEATFESHFDLTESPKRIDSLVQQTIFSYGVNSLVAVTLTIQFSIDSNNHLLINLLPDVSMSGVVIYDNYRAAQGHDTSASADIEFNTMSSHSYFYNY